MDDRGSGILVSCQANEEKNVKSHFENIVYIAYLLSKKLIETSLQKTRLSF